MWKQQPHWQPQVQKDMALKERSAKFNSPPPAKHYVSIIIISISIIIVGMLACFGQHLASIIYVHQRKRQRTATKILDSQLLLRSMFLLLLGNYKNRLAIKMLNRQRKPLIMFLPSSCSERLTACQQVYLFFSLTLSCVVNFNT